MEQYRNPFPESTFSTPAVEHGTRSVLKDGQWFATLNGYLSNAKYLREVRPDQWRTWTGEVPPAPKYSILSTVVLPDGIEPGIGMILNHAYWTMPGGVGTWVYWIELGSGKGYCELREADLDDVAIPLF